MLFPTLGFLLFFLIVAAAMAVLGTRFAAKKTVLVVASKPSTVLLADRAVLLVGGRIAATGTHRELARGEPVYRELLGIDQNGQPS